MRFTVDIASTDTPLTDAMSRYELADILITLAQVVTDTPAKQSGTIFDSRGNAVGSWVWTD